MKPEFIEVKDAFTQLLSHLVEAKAGNQNAIADFKALGIDPFTTSAERILERVDQVVHEAGQGRVIYAALRNALGEEGLRNIAMMPRKPK